MVTRALSPRIMVIVKDTVRGVLYADRMLSRLRLKRHELVPGRVA